MAGFTKKTEKSADFAKGGSTHMFGPQKVGEQKAGVTETDSGSGSGDKFAKGGSGKMFGFRGAEPAKAGQTGN